MTQYVNHSQISWELNLEGGGGLTFLLKVYHILLCWNEAILCFKLYFPSMQPVMALLTWIALIKFSKEPGKSFQRTPRCRNYAESASRSVSDRPCLLMLHWLRFNGITVKASAGYIHARQQERFCEENQRWKQVPL